MLIWPYPVLTFLFLFLPPLGATWSRSVRQPCLWPLASVAETISQEPVCHESPLGWRSLWDFTVSLPKAEVTLNPCLSLESYCLPRDAPDTDCLLDSLWWFSPIFFPLPESQVPAACLFHDPIFCWALWILCSACQAGFFLSIGSCSVSWCHSSSRPSSYSQTVCAQLCLCCDLCCALALTFCIFPLP